MLGNNSLYLILLSLFCLTTSAHLYANSMDDFDNPDFWASGTDDVNEGKLIFLTEPPQVTSSRLENTITITPDSLETGWLQMQQCHYNIDPIRAVEIVYNFHRIKDLTVDSFNNIESASVVDHRIELWNVEKGGTVCASAKTKVLEKTENGYQIASGPYLRRFLDGYYPQHVILTVNYPDTGLLLTHYLPKGTNGLSVKQEEQQAVFDAYFEGKLVLNLRFEPRGQFN